MVGPMTAARARVLALLITLTVACVGLLAPAATAGKPTTSSSSSSTLDLVLLDSADSTPNWGEHVTFKVSTTATSKPMVALDCYQGGTRVYGMTAGFYADYPFTTTYTLRSSNWTGGAADCQARLYYAAHNKTVILKTLAFTAAA